MSVHCCVLGLGASAALLGENASVRLWDCVINLTYSLVAFDSPLKTLSFLVIGFAVDVMVKSASVFKGGGIATNEQDWMAYGNRLIANRCVLEQAGFPWMVSACLWSMMRSLHTGFQSGCLFRWLPELFALDSSGSMALWQNTCFAHSRSQVQPLASGDSCGSAWVPAR